MTARLLGHPAARAAATASSHGGADQRAEQRVLADPADRRRRAAVGRGDDDAVGAGAGGPARTSGGWGRAPRGSPRCAPRWRAPAPRPAPRRRAAATAAQSTLMVPTASGPGGSPAASALPSPTVATARAAHGRPPLRVTQLEAWPASRAVSRPTAPSSPAAVERRGRAAPRHRRPAAARRCDVSARRPRAPQAEAAAAATAHDSVRCGRGKRTTSRRPSSSSDGGAASSSRSSSLALSIASPSGPLRGRSRPLRGHSWARLGEARAGGHEALGHERVRRPVHVDVGAEDVVLRRSPRARRRRRAACGTL